MRYTGNKNNWEQKKLNDDYRDAYGYNTPTTHTTFCHEMMVGEPRCPNCGSTKCDGMDCVDEKHLRPELRPQLTPYSAHQNWWAPVVD